MAVRLITFATDDFTISADRLKATALRNGVDEVMIYKPEHLENHFRETVINPLMKDTGRGYGYWAWKPFIIMKAFVDMNENDILVYSDAGAEFKDSINHVLTVMDEDIFLCANGWPNQHWCKKEVWDAVFPDRQPNGEIQVQASFIMFKKTKQVLGFIQEWLDLCMTPGFIDNEPRGPQFEGFQESRHDQMLLTLLQIKYNYRKHWFPSSTGHHIPRGTDCYPEILWHHRNRNTDWK